MHSTDTQATETADPGPLAAEMATRGFQTMLGASVDGIPCLTVRNPGASVLAEIVYACDGSFGWSWREPIAGVGRPATAAAILARVLRTVDSE
jgi:hypothetical protein